MAPQLWLGSLNTNAGKKLSSEVTQLTNKLIYTHLLCGEIPWQDLYHQLAT